MYFLSAFSLSCDPSEVQLEVKIQPNSDLEGERPLEIHGSVVVWITYWRRFLAWPPRLDPIRATEKESSVSPSKIASSPAADCCCPPPERANSSSVSSCWLAAADLLQRLGSPPMRT